MGAIVQRLLFKDNVYDSIKNTTAEDKDDLRQISVKTIEGDAVKINDLIKDFKLSIIVNTASK